MILFAKVLNIRWLMDAFCFYGGGKGGGDSSQTSYTTTLAPQLVPFATDIASQARNIAAQGYTPYQAERLASMTDAQRQALEGYKGLETSPLYDEAAGLMRRGARETTAEDIARTMSPYQQAVTDVAKRQATTEAQKMLQDVGSRAARAGAFGGARHGLIESEQYGNLAQRLSDIQTRGDQAAYESAQAQLQAERQAAMQGAQGLSGLAGAQQQAEMQRLQAMERAGTLEQADAQRLLDMRYQDFLRQRDYPKEQLGFYSSMVRGIAPMMPSQQYAYSPPPNPFQQALGLGVAGLGAYRAFQGA